MDLSSFPPSFIPTVLAIALIVSRDVRALAPIVGWLPVRWRWLPAAILAAAGVLLQQLGACAGWACVSEVAINAIVMFALAASAGVHAPSQSTLPVPDVLPGQVTPGPDRSTLPDAPGKGPR